MEHRLPHRVHHEDNAHVEVPAHPPGVAPARRPIEIERRRPVQRAQRCVVRPGGVEPLGCDSHRVDEELPAHGKAHRQGIEELRAEGIPAVPVARETPGPIDGRLAYRQGGGGAPKGGVVMTSLEDSPWLGQPAVEDELVRMLWGVPRADG